jgi:hypothetical protein
LSDETPTGWSARICSVLGIPGRPVSGSIAITIPG